MVLAFVDAPLLHSCVLVDLPGYGDKYEDDHKKNAKVIELVSLASILLYLSPAQGFLDREDMACLRSLLRVLPRYKDFPALGNLFIIATHVHLGIEEHHLKKEILGDGRQDFYNHFERTLFQDWSISRQESDERFFSFYQETPGRRKRLEEDLKLLLGEYMPSVKKQIVGEEILKFKEEGPANYAKEIDKYEKMLRDKEEAKRLYERLEKRGA